MTREVRVTNGPISRALFAWDLRDGVNIEASTGKFVARTGQRGDWSRGGVASAAGILTSNSTYTAPASLPSFEARTIDGAATTVLHMDTNSGLVFPLGWLPANITFLLSFIELGARTSANSTLLAFSGSDPTTGVRWFVDTSGTYYRVTFHNGTTSVTATLTSGQPTVGQHVLLWGQWSASGVTINQSINGGVATTASSGALAMPSAFAAGAELRINRRGTSANPATAAYQRVIVAPGLLTDAAIARYW